MTLSRDELAVTIWALISVTNDDDKAIKEGREPLLNSNRRKTCENVINILAKEFIERKES